MDQEKLEALRSKYRDQPHYVVDDPEHAKAMIAGTDMLTGIATLCDAPYREDSGRAGHCLDRRALRRRRCTPDRGALRPAFHKKHLHGSWPV